MIMMTVRYKNRIHDLVPYKVELRSAFYTVNVRIKARIQKQTHVVDFEKMGISSNEFSAADGEVFHVKL